MYSLDSTHCQTLLNDICSLKALMCIENSKLINFLYNFLVYEGGRAFAQVKTINLKKLPVILPNKESTVEFENFATQQNINVNHFGRVLSSFSRYLQSQNNIEKLSKKLQNWHELDFAEFIKELNKAIKKAGSEKLTKKDEMEWMELFEEKKAEAQVLKSEIEKTDKKIGQMVYQLYGLTEDEIKIVEDSVN